MDPGYISKRFEACCKHLKSRGLAFGDPVRPPPGSRDTALFSLPLQGKLEIFDIALMENGMMALRETNPRNLRKQVVFQQATPEFVVDIAKDLDVGYTCSHLQNR